MVGFLNWLEILLSNLPDSVAMYVECSDFGFEIAKVFELEVHFQTKMGSFMAQTQRKFTAFGKHTQCHCVNWVIVWHVNPAVKVGCAACLA